VGRQVPGLFSVSSNMATKSPTKSLSLFPERARRCDGLSCALLVGLLAAPVAAQDLICRPVASAQGAETARRALSLDLRWIVLRSGEQLEAHGSPTVHGNTLRFRAVSGTLVSTPLATIDFEATRQINREILAGRCVDRQLPPWEAARIRRVEGVGVPDEPARPAAPRSAARPDRPVTRRHTLPRRPANPHPRPVPRRPG